jgi:hypothetical protein
MSVSKIVAAAASSAGGAGLDVDEVFSTDLWVGTGSDVVVTTGIDLQNEGGIVWVKNRGRSSTDHTIWTRNDQTGWLKPNTTAAITNQNWIRDWTTTTYTAAGNSTNYASYSGDDYVGWTFRKAPKFFDVVQFNSNSGSHGITTHSHNLGVNPALIIIKTTSRTGSWYVFHQNASNNSSTSYRNYLRLNATDAEANAGAEIISANTTQFTYNSGMTEHSETHIAYLFAHHANDGSATGFGPDGDSPVISCGSYTGNGSATGPVVNLGFEPQWLMFKNASSTSNWGMIDVMRGITTDGNDTALFPDDNSDELGINISEVTPNGFKVTNTTAFANQSGSTYIFMAIRRGSLFPPEAGDATKVFAIDTASGTSPSPPHYNSGFPVDMGFYKDKSSTDSTDWYLGSRLTQGKVLKPNSTAAEANDSALLFDFQNGFNNANWTSTNYIGWMWKRAPSYFDVSLTTQGSTSVPHALSVVPEMIWSKKRNGTDDWWVTMPTISGNQYGYLNKTDAFFGGTAYGTFSSTVFTTPIIGTYNAVNYLFATVAGVSKISSVVHSGTTNVDAGFSNGSRFVLLKRTDASGDWLIWDGTRGIVSANDPYLALNSTAAEVTNTDYIDPLSSGFTLTSNLTAGTYIYYAIA